MTVHIISIDHESQRFQNLPTPKVGSTISATCILTGCGQRTSLQGSLKALPLELREMAFLKEGGISTKFKGTTFNLNSVPRLTLFTFHSGKPSSQLKRSKLNEPRQSTIGENSTSDTAPTEGPSSKRLKTSDD
jgi:hypothetical protein